MSDSHRFVIEQSHSRLDRYLAAQFPDQSRAVVQRWIRAEQVLVNDKKAKASMTLGPGDTITLTIPEPAQTELLAENIPLVILYEDDDVIAIDKPAGMVVHPAAGHHSGTLVHAVLWHFPAIEGVGEAGRPGIVHRLDKDTSGVILVAKNARAHRHLQEQFKHRMIHKTYLALVHGQMKAPEGLIDAPIGRHARHRKRMAIVPAHRGRQAQTAYEVIAYYDMNTLVAAHPLTGRTHQIRVHLASVGHPVVGDVVYGRRDVYKLGRHFLHAHRIRFARPADEQAVELTSPLPARLQALLDQLS